MNDSNQLILAVIEKLKRYQKHGYMDSFEIGEIIQEIYQAYNQENQQRLNVMMEQVTDYMTTMVSHSLTFQEFIHDHIELIALWLNCSQRTVYRKLQNNSFTLIEKQTIERKMKDYDAE